MDTRTVTRAALAAGAALGGAALFNRWSAGRAEEDYPPIGQFVEIDGVRLHYFEKGEGSPIVLLHGSSSIIQDFIVSGLVDQLATRHRVIAFDRPGYGYSERPRDIVWTPERQAALFVAAVQELGAERPLVFGHSWGTLPALAWALDHTDQLSALVLASGYYFATPRPDALVTAVMAAPVIGDLLTHTIAPLQTRVTGPLGFTMIFSPKEVPDRFLSDMPFPLMLRPSQLHATAADSGMMPLAARGLQDRYGALELPMTIIWGEGDKLVDPVAHSGRLATLLPHAQTVRLPFTGHMVHHTDLGEVVAGIEAVARP